MIRSGPAPGALGCIGSILVATILVAMAGPAGAGFAVDLPEGLRGASYVGDSDCLECHESETAGYYRGFHADIQRLRVPGVDAIGCESCHGPASMHVDSEDPENIVNPATADAELANALCITCHRDGHLDGFRSSLHGVNDVTCVSCHTVHGDQSTGLLAAAEVDLCVSCHQDTNMRLYLPSRHPVREGKMLCTDCHDPHADGYATTVPGERSVDLCFECHAGKQGPFVFEHSPVVEDCMICHDPHGTVANNLLKQNEPFLCLQCHQTHFHTTVPSRIGAVGVGDTGSSLDGYTGTSAEHSSRSTFLTKCTQCHSEVHGSDLPSQSISGQGMALTR